MCEDAPSFLFIRNKIFFVKREIMEFIDWMQEIQQTSQC